VVRADFTEPTICPPKSFVYIQALTFDEPKGESIDLRVIQNTGEATGINEQVTGFLLTFASIVRAILLER